MNIKIEAKGIKEALKTVSPEIVRKALIKSLARSAKSGKTLAISLIRDVYNIKARDLRSKITTDLHPSRFEAVVQVKDGSLPLMLFDAKQSGVSVSTDKASKKRSLRINARRRRAGGGVSVQIKMGQRKVFSNAFIAKVGGGHIGVFTRKGKGRFPIRERITIGAAGMFGSRQVKDVVAVRVREIFDKNFQHEIDFRKGK